MHPEHPLQPLRRLPPLDHLLNLAALINTIPPRQVQRISQRRQQVHSLAFDKLAVTNANVAAIVAKFPYNNPKDRQALLHAIATSTPPPTLPGRDPDYAHEHLIDQHLLVLYLLAFSLVCTNSGSSSSSSSSFEDALASAKHPVFDQYCSATLLPTEYIHLARACVLLDLGQLAEFDQAFKYARNVVDPVLAEYFVYVLAADAGLLDPTNDSIIPYVSLYEHRSVSEDRAAVARKVLVNFHVRRAVPANLVMSVCLTWSVHEAVKEAINDPKNNLVPLLSYISTHYFSPGSDEYDDTQTHLNLLRNNAHHLLPAAMGTKIRDDLISWSIMHVLDPPASPLAHIPDLAFHLLANAVDYPRAVYLHHRIAQIRKRHNVTLSRADHDRKAQVHRDMLVRMQFTHMAELRMFQAQGVAGEWAWLREEGMQDLIFTSGQADMARATAGLGLAPATKRAMPVAEWAKADTLPLEGDGDNKMLPIRSLSSGASTVELPAGMVMSGSSLDPDFIRGAPMESPERPAKVRRVDSLGRAQDATYEQHEEEPGQEEQLKRMDEDESYIDRMHGGVVELQTSQSPIRSPFSFNTPGRVGYPSVAGMPARLAPATASLAPASPPAGASQLSTPASHTSSSSRLRPTADPFPPSFAHPRTPSATNTHYPSTTPPSVASNSILHATPKRDGTPRTPSYLTLTPADAAMVIMSRRSRRSNPSTSALAVSTAAPAPEDAWTHAASAPAPAARPNSRVSVSGRPVTPFKSRLSNSSTSAAQPEGESGATSSQVPAPVLSRENVILATLAQVRAHQEEITPSSMAIHTADTPALVDANQEAPPSTPPPPPASASHQHAVADTTPTIRVSSLLPKFDYAQFHKSHHCESPTVAAQPLIAYGQQAVERAAALVASSRAAAAAARSRTSSPPASPAALPETPGNATDAHQVVEATPSTVGSQFQTSTPTVRPGRLVELAQRDEEVDVRETPERERQARRVKDAGRTPAPTARAKGPSSKVSNSRTPYETAAPTPPRRVTRAASAAAGVQTPPRYELRHKPAAAAAAPASPATRRTTMAARRASTGHLDTTAVASPPAGARKARAAAAAGEGTTPKRATTLTRAATTPGAETTTPKPRTRAGLRSAGVGGADEEPEGSKTPTQASAAGRAGAGRRAAMGVGTASASGASGVGTRRATLGAQAQQQQPVATTSARPMRAAAAGKKK